MVRKCLKCGAVNEAAAGSPTEACPNCSVIYAKAEAAAAAAKSPPLRPVSTAKPIPKELRLPLWPTVACVVCLIVGFFVGREQMRYQVANAMTGALAHAFDGLASKPLPAAPRPSAPNAESPPTEPAVAQAPAVPAEIPPAPPKEPTIALKPSITAKLVKKGFRDQDEPPRDSRRLFGLSHAAFANATCWR
jgi:predicted  nucleic acid-binding Zn-ribbon protein